MAISTIGTDALASAAVTSAKLASGAPSRSQLPAGTVLQVVSATTTTPTTTTSGSFVDTSLSATITPTSTSSKVLVLVNGTAISQSNASGCIVRIVRNSTEIVLQGAVYASTNTAITAASCPAYLDSPATTSATTYKVQIRNQDSVTSVGFTVDFSAVSNEASTITLMEIAA